MSLEIFSSQVRHPLVVGSFGSQSDLLKSSAQAVAEACDIAEIRLDLLDWNAESPAPWRHLSSLPLLFTARRLDEGGAMPLDSDARMNLLGAALGDAACIDIEVASIGEMEALLAEVRARKLPWIASFHHFESLPLREILDEAANRAREAGATLFKAAARLHSPSDLAALADFQLADHGIPVATMGMGPLAPVSRLLCAQSGSLLNYGYLGDTPTAPGQWDSALLKLAISKLVSIGR
jgi:3-dehydroquinate dehydratase-1